MLKFILLHDVWTLKSSLVGFKKKKKAIAMLWTLPLHP